MLDINTLEDPNAALDVSDCPIPLPLDELFRNEGDLAIEIGSGYGEFLTEMALIHREKNFLGIEVKSKRFRKAVKKANSQNISNIRFLHMDANIAAEELFYPNTISLAYVNFPDPWHKDKHKKHRIINRQFLEVLSRTMKRNACLEIVSDYHEYMLYTTEILNGVDCFNGLCSKPTCLRGDPERPMTKYEKKFRLEGREIYYLKFTNVK